MNWRHTVRVLICGREEKTNDSSAEASTVDVEGQSEGGAAAADEGEFTWFEEEAEEEEAKH